MEEGEVEGIGRNQAKCALSEGSERGEVVVTGSRGGGECGRNQCWRSDWKGVGREQGRPPLESLDKII